MLTGLRLGSEKLNPIYKDCLKAMLSLDWYVGIIGGRPKHSEHQQAAEIKDSYAKKNRTIKIKEEKHLHTSFTQLINGKR
jgi:Peptidase family C54